MREILPRVWHWTTFHEGIGQPVHSCYLAGPEPAALIDPRVPGEGLEWFRGRAAPCHAYLTNRHHFRHSDRFSEAFGTRIWCHRDGLHEFTRGEEVTPFLHGESLPGGILALEIGALCPEETALFVPSLRLVALGDSLIREDGGLAFVPDAYMGEDPEGVKEGLRLALGKLLERDFEHLLLAHGAPLVGNGRERLRDFLAG